MQKFAQKKIVATKFALLDGLGWKYGAIYPMNEY
jgi:hypothetical protein